MNYDVYAGGFHVVDAKLDVDMTAKNRYRLELSAATQGFLRTLAPWDGVFKTNGWLDPKNIRPQTHQSITTWKDEDETKTYTYNRDGTFKEYRVKDPENDGSPKPVESELTKNTTDALSATLGVMQNMGKTGKCEGTSDVFDGSRRYRMTFVHQQDTVLQSNNYNVYAGPAVECTVEVQPMGGKWHKKPRGWMSIQEQGRERGTMPTIWMAKMSDAGPAVPVKIRVKTEHGTLFMHLTGYQNGSKSLKLED